MTDHQRDCKLQNRGAKCLAWVIHGYLFPCGPQARVGTDFRFHMHGRVRWGECTGAPRVPRASRRSQPQLDRSSRSVRALSRTVRGAEVQALALSMLLELHSVSHGPEPQFLALSVVLTLHCAVHEGCHWRCPWCWNYTAHLTVLQAFKSQGGTLTLF